MSSKAEICNLALQLLGQNSNIVDLDSDNTRNAVELKTAYAATLDAALYDHAWIFALVLGAWPVSATAPAWGFTKAYPFATNPYCLRVVRLDPDHHSDDPGTWRVIGREVHTDEGAPLYVEYVSRVTDEALFDPLFVEYFAAKLAEKVAYRITGKSDKAPEMREYRKELARDARWASAIATGRRQPRAGDWLSSRGTG